ncbi:MAG TPA: FHA domain-containing protein, partial [Bryobacteraceae bacterium]|nr:FHA domain-containing protein [Bryobacteraceae bacterium]
MVVILEAVAGPVLGRRIEVRGGSIVRIGRAGKSDYVIAEDGYLSGAHFSVECDGTQCRIRDLGSSNGTFVNGS